MPPRPTPHPPPIARRRAPAARWVTCAVSTALGLAACHNYRTLEELEESRAQLEAVEADPEYAAPTDALDERFKRVKRLFVPRPARTVGTLERFPMREGETADRLVTLEADGCYAFVVVAADDAFDVDLVVEGPDAQERAADRSPDAFPVVPSLCVDAGGVFAVRIVAHRGAGEVKLGVFALDAPEADAAQRLDTIAAAAFPGAVPLGADGRALLRPGESFSTPFALSPGCYGFAAIGDARVRDLDLVLVDDHGAELAADRGVDATPRIDRACTSEGGAVRLQFRPYDGVGEIWWRAFALPSE